MNDRITIFLPTFGMGGIGRMMVNLAGGMAAAGFQVDFIVNRKENLPFFRDLAEPIRIVELKLNTPKQIAAGLSAYLRKEKPRILLSSRMKNGHPVALLSRDQAGVATRVFLRIPTHMTRRGQNQNIIKRWLEKGQIRKSVRRADGIIAVSKGIAEDISRISGFPRESIHILPNPVISDGVGQMAKESIDHPWFGPGEPPVILSAGGFRNQKDFPTLIRAFAELRGKKEARLMILGRGRLKDRMLKLASQLGIENDLCLPGFIDRPYAYMANADIFVLSSAWEGSPNVLVESMAVGTPVVSTDCPSGPREILRGGELGRLVPVGDQSALASAMLDTLAAPLPARKLQTGALRYTIKTSAAAYLNAFGCLD
jgi:glycosyltransferase involved in cell wall biosynthesis